MKSADRRSATLPRLNRAFNFNSLRDSSACPLNNRKAGARKGLARIKADRANRQGTNIGATASIAKVGHRENAVTILKRWQRGAHRGRDDRASEGRIGGGDFGPAVAA
jgi:hypothetical protein